MPKPRGAGKSVVKSLSIDLKSAPLWTDTSLNSNPFDFVLCYVLLAAIVDARRLRVGVRGHLLRFFEFGVRVLEVRRNPRAAKRVIANRRVKPRGFGSPADHVPGFGSIQTPAAQHFCSAADRLKERCVRVIAETCCLDVVEQVGL